MVSRLTLAVVSAFAISLLMVGTGGAAKCTPHCAPDNSNRDGEFSPAKSNKGGELRGQDRSDWVHQYKNGGGTGGDPTPPPPPTTPPPPSTTPPPPPTVPPPPPDPLPPPGV